MRRKPLTRTSRLLGWYRLETRPTYQQQERQAGEDDTEHECEIIVIGDHRGLPRDLVISTAIPDGSVRLKAPSGMARLC